MDVDASLFLRSVYDEYTDVCIHTYIVSFGKLGLAVGRKIVAAVSATPQVCGTVVSRFSLCVVVVVVVAVAVCCCCCFCF